MHDLPAPSGSPVQCCWLPASCGGAVRIRPGPAAGRETSAASVASYALSQQMPVDPEVVVGTLPNGLRYYVRANGEAGPPRRAAARRQGRFGARRRRPAGAGALRRAHGVRRHAALSPAEHRRLPVVARLEHRAGRERGDELRRHAVHAARADRRARRARSRAARPRGLGAGRHVRSERHRPRARHRPLGMADAPRRGRADAGQDPPRAARRIALRGSAADRQARHHRARAARAADAVLPRLVPPGSDGRDRRRRRRSRRRRRR